MFEITVGCCSRFGVIRDGVGNGFLGGDSIGDSTVNVSFDSCVNSFKRNNQKINILF